MHRVRAYETVIDGNELRGNQQQIFEVYCNQLNLILPNIKFSETLKKHINYDLKRMGIIKGVKLNKYQNQVVRAFMGNGSLE